MKKGTVLIIEDNRMNLEMTRILLEDAGYQTLEAENATIGIQKAQAEHPDFILMDLHLPQMDGYEATSILKSRHDTQNIPIIAVTALVMDGDDEKAIAAGCVGVIHKPIDISSFMDTIERFVYQSQH